jgi:hypothetical protein
MDIVPIEPNPVATDGDRLQIHATSDRSGAVGLISLGDRVMADLCRTKAHEGVSLLSINADVVSLPDIGADLVAEAQITRATKSVIFVSSTITGPQGIVMTLTALYKLAKAESIN